MFDWVVVSLLGLAFIGLAISFVGLWVGSEEIMTLALLGYAIAFGAMFITAGVWSIFANGGPHIISAVILIGFGLFKIVYFIGRLYGD